MRYQPASMDIEPNVRCNLSCYMCQTSNWDRDAEDLHLDRFKEFLAKTPATMKIKLQGMGEPLLSRHFFDLVSYAKDQGIRVETTSNGTTLHSATHRERILNSGLSSLIISLDAARRETFESIRIGADFPKIIDGLRQLVKERGDKKAPAIRVWMVGMKSNIHELPELIRLCADLGVDEFILQCNLVNWGKEEWQTKIASYDLSEAVAADQYIEEARQISRPLKLPFSVFQGNSKFSVQDNRPCTWPWHSAYLTAEGKVTPCCVASDPKVVAMGDLNVNTFEEIWNGEKYRLFRKSMLEGKIPTFCKGCYRDYEAVYDLDAVVEKHVDGLSAPRSSS